MAGSSHLNLSPRTWESIVANWNPHPEPSTPPISNSGDSTICRDEETCELEALIAEISSYLPEDSSFSEQDTEAKIEKLFSANVLLNHQLFQHQIAAASAGSTIFSLQTNVCQLTHLNSVLASNYLNLYFLYVKQQIESQEKDRQIEELQKRELKRMPIMRHVEVQKEEVEVEAVASQKIGASQAF